MEIELNGTLYIDDLGLVGFMYSMHVNNTPEVSVSQPRDAVMEEEVRLHVVEASRSVG